MKTKPNHIDVHVGQRVRQARLTAGISQEALAEKIGKTFQQLQKQEKGANRISCSRLHAIGAVVGRPVSWFFEGLPNQADMLKGPQIDDPVQILANSGLGVDLARAFNAIHDPALRHALVKTVEAAAAISGPAKRKAA